MSGDRPSGQARPGRRPSKWFNNWRHGHLTGGPKLDREPHPAASSHYHSNSLTNGVHKVSSLAERDRYPGRSARLAADASAEGLGCRHRPTITLGGPPELSCGCPMEDPV